MKMRSPRRRSTGLDRTGCAARLNVHAIVEPQVDVVDVGHPIPERRGHLDVRLQAFDEPFFPEVELRGIPVEEHDDVSEVRDVNLR